jgi:hypothetical protein
MWKKERSNRRKDFYQFISVCLNIYLAVAAIMFMLYLGAPLLGGKLFPRAIIIYGSWIVMSVYLKALLKKSQKGLRITLHEHVLLSLYTIACVFLWFPYPISLFFTILSVVGIAFSYKAQQGLTRALEGDQEPRE